LSVGAALLGLSLLACDKGDQQAAAEAQREAAAKAEKAQMEANEKISEARREAEKVANDAARERSEARMELQKDVDAVDRKISYLKERASAVKGDVKKNADVARAEAETRRTTLQTNFRKLETETGAAWDSAKAEVKQNISELKAAVDSWENTVSDSKATKTAGR
jgi:chromosome segregation ATPase